MTAEEIARTIDETLMELRDSIGTTEPTLYCHVLEGDDGRWVSTQPMSAFETYMVWERLYGQEVATYNLEVLQGKRALDGEEERPA